MKAVLMIAALLLGACSTMPTAYDAGTEAQKINDRAIRVSAHGNGATPPALVSDYLLLKAAEETLRQGHAGFAILNEKDNSQHVTRGVHLIQIPAQEAVVRLLTADEIKATPGAFTARQVWNNLAPRYIKSKR